MAREPEYSKEECFKQISFHLRRLRSFERKCRYHYIQWLENNCRFDIRMGNVYEEFVKSSAPKNTGSFVKWLEGNCTYKSPWKEYLKTPDPMMDFLRAEVSKWVVLLQQHSHFYNRELLKLYVLPYAEEDKEKKEMRLNAACDNDYSEDYDVWREA